LEHYWQVCFALFTNGSRGVLAIEDPSALWSPY